MKKLFCALLFVTILSTGWIWADAQFRLAPNVGLDFADKPSLADVKRSFDSGADIFTGFHWEVITAGNVGFGMHYLATFDKIDTPDEYYPYDWWLDWNGDIFLSYHLFGGGAFFDPFIEVGYGSVGRLHLTPTTQDYWVKEQDGSYTYDPPDSSSEYQVLTNMSLFPYIGGGLALDLNGFLLGAKFSWRPFSHEVPGTYFANYPLKSFQVAFTAGFALGGHKGKKNGKK